MKRIGLIGLIALLFTAVFVLSAGADEEKNEYHDREEYENDEGPFGGLRPNRIERSLKRAGATDGQVAQVIALMESLSDENKELRVEQRRLRDEIHDEYRTAAPDRAKLKRLIEEAANSYAQARIATLEMSLDARAIVGEDVWDKVTRGQNRSGHRRGMMRHSNDQNDH